MEQPPYNTDEKLSEYLTRYLEQLMVGVNSLKEQVRVWTTNGFTGSFIGNLLGDVTGDLSGNVTGNVSGNVTTNAVKFPATQVASSNANTLDDYEEGTFAPVVTPGTGAITTYTSSGNYTKIGNLVAFNFRLAISNNGTGAVNIDITLPFTSGVYAVGTARESAATGVTCSVSASPGDPSATIFTYDNAYPGGTSHVIQGSIVYQV